MQEPGLPPNEEARLKALKALHVLDTPSEERFDCLTRLAQKMFKVPIAAVSLVDSKRLWFKSVQGLSVAEISRRISFCGHAILGNEPMIVPDTLRDSRFEDNPLVTGKLRIRFYAGDPIRSAEGHKLGAFCLIDTKPRSLNQEEMESLRDFTRLAEGEMNRKYLGKAQQDLIRDYYDLRKKSMVDTLTRLWNRGAILEVLDRELDHARRDRSFLGLLMADLDHFKKINDTRGHPAGDEVLREVARRIRSSVRLYDIVGRIGGEEFLVLLPGLRSQSATEAAERIRIAVKKYPVKTSRGRIFPTLSIGVASYPEGKGAKSLIEQADAALYAAKRAGRDCVREVGGKTDLCHSS